jgi:FkbM family methyltransferase
MDYSIPEHCKRVKIDVGLSYHAPNIDLWLELDPDVFVLGFEPNVYNLKRIYNDFHLKSNPPLFRKLPHHFINKEAAIIPFALGNEEKFVSFYCTKEDPGCSSIYEPNTLEVLTKTEVPCYKLDTILKKIDWQRFPYIDGMKIDAQGHDYEILLGCEENIEKICYIFIEITSENLYKDCGDKWPSMKSFLEGKGFVLQEIAPRGYNALFRNTRIPSSYLDTVKPIFIDS